MTNSERPIAIALLAFPESSASVVHGMYDVFMAVGRDWGFFTGGDPGPQLMQPLIVSAQAGAFAATNGVQIVPQARMADCPAPNLICVPDVNVRPGEELAGRFGSEIAWLRRCHEAGAVIAAACSGTLLLAEAGLLDGFEATTHWAYCDDLERRFPRVRVCPRRALVITGEGQRLVMAGGGTTWLDLAIYLVARTVGVDAAMQVARINLINWHDVGPQPYAQLARSRQSQDLIIARCQEWIAQHYRHPSPVSAMVDLSGLAERSFSRRFQQATGLSPLQYVHTLRIEEAKQMLESGDEPVEAIANEVGYEDAGFFGRLFQRNVSLTPAQYRKRFGTMRRALQHR
ncbi:MAG: GlxA family transcriptional regulator [Gammaproteobacteria bacterium]